MKLRSIVNNIICRYEDGYKKRKNDTEDAYEKWLVKTTKETEKLLMKLIREAQ